MLSFLQYLLLTSFLHIITFELNRASSPVRMSSIIHCSPLHSILTHLKMPSVWSPLRPRTSSERRVCTQGSWLSGYLSFWSAITSSSEEPNMEGLKMAFLACLISSRQGFCRPWTETHTRTHTEELVLLQQGRWRAAWALGRFGPESSGRSRQADIQMWVRKGHAAHHCAFRG